MYRTSISIVALALVCPQNYGEVACSSDDPTSLLQSDVAVKKRGQTEMSVQGMAEMSNFQDVVGTGEFSAPAAETAVEVESLLAKSIRWPHALTGEVDPEEAIEELDMLEIGLDVLHGSPTKPKSRSTLQVLISCSAVIVLLAIGWGLYYLATKGGDELPNVKLVLLMLSFAVCSWGMNVVNKTLVKSLGTPTIVTGAQMFMTVMASLILARDKLTGTFAEVFKWCFVPFIFFAMLVSSFYTYKYLTLSMLMVVRNLGPIITLPIETMVMPADKKPYITVGMVMSLAGMLGFTFFYTNGLVVKMNGIWLALLNMLLAITDRVVQRRLLTTECKGLSTETCMFLNNFVGIFPTIVMSLCVGEFAKVDAKKFFLSMTTVLLILSGIIGTGICYFAIAVQREISATSFMVLQNCVRMAVVVVGVAIFMDPIGWPWQVIGLILTFLAAIGYGKAQLDGLAELKALEAQKKAESARETESRERSLAAASDAQVDDAADGKPKEKQGAQKTM